MSKDQGQKVRDDLRNAGSAILSFFAGPEAFIKQKMNEHASPLSAECETCGGAGELGAKGHKVPCPACTPKGALR